MEKITIVEGLVSCIIPCFNAEKYLKQCLESIICQDYNKIEIILIDDGSLDGTIQILKTFSQNYKEKFYNIQILQHEKNKGICAAINTGLKCIHGEYICWFDADDLLAEECLKYKVEFLRENPQYKCVMGIGEIFQNDNEKDVVGFLGNHNEVGNIFENYLFQFCATSPGLNMTYSNVLLELLPETGLPEDVTEQNWYLMLILASAVDIGFLNKVVYRYRINMNSDSHKNPLKTGKQHKKFWDKVDCIRFHAIDDSVLPYSYRCRVLKLQAENSIADRLLTIDQEQVQNDSKYVDYIVKMYFENGRILSNMSGRSVYLYGHSEKQIKLKRVLDKYIPIRGYIDSFYENEEEAVILADHIQKETMYIIITLQYHQEIIEKLEKKNFHEYNDFYYPKYNIYNSLREFKNIDFKKME